MCGKLNEEVTSNGLLRQNNRPGFWPRFYIVVLGMTFFSLQFTFSNFYLDFYFPFFLGLLFSLFSLDFYFPFFWGLLFSLWTFIFPFLIGLLFPFFLWTFIFSLDVYSIAVTFWISSKFFLVKSPLSLMDFCHLTNFVDDSASY